MVRMSCGSDAETPPLARGRRNRNRAAACKCRNTPARAGKAARYRGRRARMEKHPRSRGEGWGPLRQIEGVAETPPLARGRLDSVVADGTVVRNTPARAGKATQSDKRRTAQKKHPRSRGEGPLSISHRMLGAETPPLARGRPPTAFQHGNYQGNTPARAGKAESVRDYMNDLRKHPRSRGEGTTTNAKQSERSETPPLARGRQWRPLDESLAGRNTPARAGKAQRGPCPPQRRRKHPRSRGEGSQNWPLAPSTGETPPLARGRHSVCYNLCVVLRNTPARAGKAGFQKYGQAPNQKHPRSRGEGTNI